MGIFRKRSEERAELIPQTKAQELRSKYDWASVMSDRTLNAMSESEVAAQDARARQFAERDAGGINFNTHTSYELARGERNKAAIVQESETSLAGLSIKLNTWYSIKQGKKLLPFKVLRQDADGKFFCEISDGNTIQEVKLAPDVLTDLEIYERKN